jgi:hypothetical protein
LMWLLLLLLLHLHLLLLAVGLSPVLIHRLRSVSITQNNFVARDQAFLCDAGLWPVSNIDYPTACYPILTFSAWLMVPGSRPCKPQTTTLWLMPFGTTQPKSNTETGRSACSCCCIAWLLRGSPGLGGCSFCSG